MYWFACSAYIRLHQGLVSKSFGKLNQPVPLEVSFSSCVHNYKVPECQ